jgi:hypothetical protein
MLLLAWIVGILLPFYSFGHLSPAARAVFDFVFHTHTSHVLMHAFLYAVLAYLLASFARGATALSGRDLVCVVAGVAVVAGLQEVIQAASEQIPVGADEIFDFFVDMDGGMLGLLLFVRSSRQAGPT